MADVLAQVITAVQVLGVGKGGGKPGQNGGGYLTGSWHKTAEYWSGLRRAGAAARNGGVQVVAAGQVVGAGNRGLGG